MAIIRPKFKESDIRNYVNKRIQILEDVVFDRLQQIGEQFLIDARNTNSYKDRTGNLRSSIGYVIYKDGEEVFGNFEGTEVGKQTSRRLISQLKVEYPRGYILIAVAGMSYAAAVESKGYDVITGSVQMGEENARRSFDRLKQSLKKLR